MDSLRVLIGSTLLLLPLTGCLVQSKKGTNGDNDVSIATPLGGMTVKTDSASVQGKVGLPLYPGATPEKKQGKDNGSADVNMNFGDFHLRVLALGFDSSDSPAKIEAFYRKALAQYSDVIACKDKQPLGSPAKTGLGLTCADDDKEHSRGGNHIDSDETQLKAGSPSRQHIVALKQTGSGTHFGLIALELPRGDDKGA